MMDPREIVLSKVDKIFQAQGYKINNLPSSWNFPWRPDLMCSRKGKTYSFLIRESALIPQLMLERIAQTRTRISPFYICIIFLSRPHPSVLKMLPLYGIGASIFDGRRLETLQKSKNFSRSVVPVKKITAPNKKMQKTEIFLSSYQKISEREIAKGIVDEIRENQKFPIYAFQAEDDQRFGGKQTKKCIDEGLKNCDWFVVILDENWRKWVNYEVRQAIKIYFKNKHISVYVKYNKKTFASWKRLIDWIEQKTKIKYTPYRTQKELKIKLRLRLLEKIQNVHKNRNIPMYTY